MKTFLLAAALAAGFSAAAFAATETPAKPAARACFFTSQWNGWKARDENTMYLRVGTKNVYEVGFKHGCRQATYPGMHLVTVQRTGGSVCSPIDLDIKVADSSSPSFATPCIATSLRKLTAEEANTIPKQFRP
jgi:hypothetical protein